MDRKKQINENSSGGMTSKNNQLLKNTIFAVITFVLMSASAYFGARYVVLKSESTTLNFFIILSMVFFMVLFAFPVTQILMALIYKEKWEGLKFFDKGKALEKKLKNEEDDFDVSELKPKTFQFSLIITIVFFVSGIYANFLSKNVLFNLREVTYDTILRQNKDIPRKLRILKDIAAVERRHFIEKYSFYLYDVYRREKNQKVKEKILWVIAEFCHRMKKSTLLNRQKGDFKTWEENLYNRLKQKYLKIFVDIFKIGKPEERKAAFFGIVWLSPETALKVVEIYKNKTDMDKSVLKSILVSLTYTGDIDAIPFIYHIYKRFKSDEEIAVYSIYSASRIFFIFFESSDFKRLQTNQYAKDKILTEKFVKTGIDSETQNIANELLKEKNLSKLCAFMDMLYILRDTKYENMLKSLAQDQTLWEKKCKRFEYPRVFAPPVVIVEDELFEIKVLRAISGIIIGNKPLINFLKKLQENPKITPDMKKTIKDIFLLLKQQGHKL